MSGSIDGQAGGIAINLDKLSMEGLLARTTRVFA